MSKQLVLMILALSSIAMSTACISRHGVVTTDVNPLGWQSEAVARIVFDNADTLRARDIKVVVRYNRSAHDAMLPLIIQTITPDSLTTVENVEIPLNISPGKADDMMEAEITYRTNATLSKKGEYIFNITPDPKVVPVKGITAVGLDFL